MVGEKGLTPEVADHIGDYVQQHGEAQTLPLQKPSIWLKIFCVCACGCVCVSVSVCTCTHTCVGQAKT